MRYEGSIYRPPSEAYSYILQVTIGCSHNACTFCGMYKEKNFRLRSKKEILEDLDLARKECAQVKRIFLADGNALVMKTEEMLSLLEEIQGRFPEVERISLYAAPKDLLRKSSEDLKAIREAGIDMVYLGVESGSDNVLRKINKGCSSEEMIEAGRKAMEAGMTLSVTLISGIGGKKLSLEHAVESARVVSKIKPHYLGLLTLLVQEGTPLFNEIQNGEFALLSPGEALKETKILIRKLELDETIFRGNHPSNYVALSGTLPFDKDKLLKEIDHALENEETHLRGDQWRRL